MLRLYICLILIFLTCVCFLLIKDMLNVFYRYYFLSSEHNISQLPEYNLKKLIHYLLKDKQVFIVVSLLELCLKNKMYNNTFIYIKLAYCYNVLAHYNASNYYYNQALLYKSKCKDSYTLKLLSEFRYDVN